MDQAIVREELKKVLADSRFVQSGRLTKFLSFVVETQLEAPGSFISEFAIADEVFGKTKNFDPVVDSIVRVTAGRLRTTLASYYEEIGEIGDVKISMPAGTYTPKFDWIDNSADEEVTTKSILPDWMMTRQGKNRSIAALGFAAIITFWLTSHVLSHYNRNVVTSLETVPIAKIENYPTLAVLPFENTTGEARFDNLEKGFQRQIVRDLFSFGTLKIEKIDTTLNDLTQNSSSHYDFAITGRILKLQPDTKIFVTLTEISSGDIVNNFTISKPKTNTAYSTVLAEISTEAVNRILGQEGALLKREIRNIQSRINNNSLVIKELSAFECYAIFEHYLSDFTAENFEKTRLCAEEELESNPDDATMLSVKSFLEIEIAFLNKNPKLKKAHPALKDIELDPAITYETTFALAERAVELEPTNSIALKHLGDMQRFNKDFLSAEYTLSQVLRLNPGDADAIAVYSMVQNSLGNFDYGYQLALEALARSQNPESFYYGSLLQNATARQDLEDLKVYIKPFTKLNRNGEYFNLIYQAAIAALEDDTETVSEISLKLEKFCELLEFDILKGLKDNIAPQQTFESLESMFESANITPCEQSTENIANRSQ